MISAHRALKGINLTVEALNLPPELIGLLLGLSHEISIALGRVGQVSKLQGKNKNNSFADSSMYNELVMFSSIHGIF